MKKLFAPNFPRHSGNVLIPKNWRSEEYWPNQVVDPALAGEIQKLIDDYGSKIPDVAFDGLMAAFECAWSLEPQRPKRVRFWRRLFKSKSSQKITAPV